MQSLHSRKAEERFYPEQWGRQGAPAEFSAVVGAAVGLAVSFMSPTDSLGVLHSEPKPSSGHLKTRGDSTRVTFWIPILKALALEDPLPPAVHETSCTEGRKSA